MAGRIFVNYRRDDARDMAARIRDRLAQMFGNAGVFMDVDNLLTGQRFDRALDKALGQTDVFPSAVLPHRLGGGHEAVGDHSKSASAWFKLKVRRAVPIQL